MKRIILSFAAMLMAWAVTAETFYWSHDQSNNTYFSWGDWNSWYVGDQREGSNPDHLVPGANDYIHYMRKYNSYACYDLDNTTYTVKGFSFSNWKQDWGFRYLKYRNGTLEVTSCYTNLRVQATIEQNGRLVFGPNCGAQLGFSSSALNSFDIKDTGSMKVGGNVELGRTQFTVRDGGALELCPAKLALGQGSNYDAGNPESVRFDNSGTMTLTSGMDFVKGYGYNNNGTVRFVQKAGTMTFGCGITRAAKLGGTFVFELRGGTLNVSASADLSAFDTVSMPAEDSTATIAVASGLTFDFSKATYAAGATLVKAGDGTLTLEANAPATLQIDAGNVRLTKDVSLGTVALGGVLTIVVPEITVAAMTDLAQGLVVVDTTNIPNGARVLISEDGALLDDVLSKATVQGGGTLNKIGNALVLSKVDADANVFTATGEKDFSDATAWSKGAPTAGQDLVISGEGTTCVLKKADVATTYGSITVVAGATLKVAEALTLPTVNLQYLSRLLFTKGTSTLPLGSIQAVASAGAMPVVEVVKGAAIQPGLNFAFKNVFLKLYGNLSSPGSPLTLGCADNGETAYFSMVADAVTIDLAGSPGSGHDLRWVMPAEGGTVVVPYGISLTNCTVTSTWNQNYVLQIGVNNPTSEAFDFVLDGTKFKMRGSGSSIVRGGAKIHAKNGGGFFDDITGGVSWSFPKVYGKATLLFEGEGSGVYHYYSRLNTEYLSDVNGAEQMTFKDGAAWQVGNGGQNGKTSVFVFDNGCWDLIEKPYYTKSYWDGTDVYKPTGYPVPASKVQDYLTEIFAGLKAVRIVSGASVAIRSYQVDPQEDLKWNRSKTIAQVPITGENGSLFVTNCTPGYSMEAIMTYGKNTATGEAWAEKCDDGAKLTFADGSNWAGTVRGDEGIGFTNLTEVAKPARVAFGGIRFTGKLPIRVWKNGTTITTNDTIDVLGTLTAGQGKKGFSPVIVGNGTFAVDDEITLGTCPADQIPTDSRALSADKHWVIKTEPIAGTDRVVLKLKYVVRGLMVYVR